MRRVDAALIALTLAIIGLQSCAVRVGSAPNTFHAREPRSTAHCDMNRRLLDHPYFEPITDGDGREVCKMEEQT